MEIDPELENNRTKWENNKTVVPKQELDESGKHQWRSESEYRTEMENKRT